MTFLPGDKVLYRRTHPGGYGYETTYPATVIKVHGDRATIVIDRGGCALFERVVTVARLSASPAEEK